ncbi:MAG: phospholipase D-like domain-containing protein [Oligoflexus sp.]
MMHTKTAIFDDEVAFVSSFNFDGISFDSNAEVIAILRGADSVSQALDIWQMANTGRPCFTLIAN